MTLEKATAEKPLLVLATHNPGKIRELRSLLAEHLPELDLEKAVVGAAEVGAPDVKEDGVSFEENSLLKARAVANHTGVASIADDSGLAVVILGGAPGIFSARWSGKHGDDRANLDLLLAQLADVRPEHRAASFVCVASLVTPEGQEIAERGEMAGSLITTPRGAGGFGYDPIFVPAGLNQSAAEISPEHKNAISHRGKAFRALVPHVVEYLRLVSEDTAR
ncbi:RdgB/HAM1 family non-canonical purine NTP pyrophosphatase [Haematomicrobium sanguinis]|uniref:RdgB/HAM1 family non-canonical purine NTP pyrophosphatase n=1 Tax=Haematomicrobium sanguinis TaxID=479106 RepID=UPI00047DC5DC|nr:RdgB/HAM1 family non-canonical purine NTP pyrophosphatase [Haematomicrobium sanguinis]